MSRQPNQDPSTFFGNNRLRKTAAKAGLILGLVGAGITPIAPAESLSHESDAAAATLSQEAPPWAHDRFYLDYVESQKKLDSILSGHPESGITGAGIYEGMVAIWPGPSPQEAYAYEGLTTDAPSGGVDNEMVAVLDAPLVYKDHGDVRFVHLQDALGSLVGRPDGQEQMYGTTHVYGQTADAYVDANYSLKQIYAGGGHVTFYSYGPRPKMVKAVKNQFYVLPEGLDLSSVGFFLRTNTYAVPRSNANRPPTAADQKRLMAIYKQDTNVQVKPYPVGPLGTKSK